MGVVAHRDAEGIGWPPAPLRWRGDERDAVNNKEGCHMCMALVRAGAACEPGRTKEEGRRG